MTIKYTVLDQGSFLYARADDVLTTIDLITHARDMMRDTSVVPRYRYLLDVRYVKRYEVDADRLFFWLRHAFLPVTAKIIGSRCAIVAHDTWWFNVSLQRRYEPLGVTMIAFNDPATACRWLGMGYGCVLQQVASSGCGVRVEPWEMRDALLVGGS